MLMALGISTILSLSKYTDPPPRLIYMNKSYSGSYVKSPASTSVVIDFVVLSANKALHSKVVGVLVVRVN